MRINVYTEELLTNADRSQPPLAQVVYAEYVSSRTGEKMRNYGLRIFLKSHPDLHYIPGRDDDRSAITFWCGPKEKTIFEWLETVRQVAYATTLDTWREKTEQQQAGAVAALEKRMSKFGDPINPDYYKNHPSGVECITITEHYNFNLGNAVKYIWRGGGKENFLQDLKKARWYLDREIQKMEKELGAKNSNEQLGNPPTIRRDVEPRLPD